MLLSTDKDENLGTGEDLDINIIGDEEANEIYLKVSI